MVAGMDGKDVHKARPLKAKITIGEPVRLRARKHLRMQQEEERLHRIKKQRSCATATDGSAPHASQADAAHSELLREIWDLRDWAERPSEITDERLLAATKRLRQSVSSEDNHPGITQAIINAGMVPILVRLLRREHDPQTVYEAAYALVNITYVTCEAVAGHKGAIQQLGVLVTKSPVPEIRELAAWCFGNMSCESEKYRDAILNDPETVKGLLRNLSQPASAAVLKTVSWVCRCMVRRSPRMNTTHCEAFVTALVECLNKCEAFMVEVSVRVNAVMCLTKIMGWGEEIYDKCLRWGVLETLIALIHNHVRSADSDIILYAVRALGKLPPDNPVLSKRLLGGGFLQCSHALLDHNSPDVQEITCSILRKIVTSAKSCAHGVFQSDQQHDLTRQLIQLSLHGEYNTRVHASWAVSGLVNSLPSGEMHILDAYGAIDVLVKALRMASEVELISKSLQALYRILFIRGKTAVVKFEELYGEDIVNDLLNHPEDEVYLPAYDLQMALFNGESIYSEDEDDFSCVLREHDESFSFSLPSKQLFPTDCSMEGPPETPIRQLGGFASSPNVLDMSIGETAQI